MTPDCLPILIPIQNSPYQFIHIVLFKKSHEYEISLTSFPANPLDTLTTRTFLKPVKNVCPDDPLQLLSIKTFGGSCTIGIKVFRNPIYRRPIRRSK